MSFMSTISRYLEHRRRARTNRRTRILVESLPPEIQHDIGWRATPGNDDAVQQTLRRRQ